MMDFLDLLRDQHPFDLLTEEGLQRAGQNTRTRTFAAGASILQRGGPPSDCLFLIAAGSVHLVSEDGAGLPLDVGDFFGHPSLISGLSPMVDVVAQVETTVHCLPGPIFKELLANPAFSEFFLQDLGQRLRRQGRSADLGRDLLTPAGELGLRPLITVTPDATVADAARAMRSAREDAVIAMEASGPPLGIITDHDFQTKVLAEDRGPGTLVSEIMTRNLKTLPEDTPAHSALLFMLEQGIHHLPLTRDDAVIGLVTATDLLRHQTRNPVFLSRFIERVEDPAELQHYSRDAAALVERLVGGGLKVGQVGRILANVNDSLFHRLIALAERDLGAPPCAFAWVVFGSEGRMEQALLTDQDNALIYAEETPENARYFQALAGRVVGDLQIAGFPPCPGGYMATNWCRSLDAWQELMSSWVNTPTPEALMMAGIFFDFRVVAGELDIASLEDIVLDSADNELFTAYLAREALRFRPPLNMFRRISARDGRVDLKKGGIAPLVAAGRVFGIRAGSGARPTRERYEAAHAAGLISEDLSRIVIETYRFLLGIRLREQLEDLHHGREAGNEVLLKRLSSLEQRHLKDAFGVIRELQDLVGRKFRVDLLGG